MTAPVNTTFVSGTTITSDWLNGVNDHVSDLETSAHDSANIDYLQGATGSVVRNLGDKLRESVSVLDFGADPTGASDSSVATQAAIAALPSSGGVVVFPSGGTYLINGMVTVKDNTTISAYGASIKVGSYFVGQSKAVFSNFTGTIDVPTTITAASNVSFLGLNVDGQNPGVDGTTIANANMQGAIICLGGWTAGSGVASITVKDCSMKSFAGVGAMLWNSSDVTIEGNSFANFFANTSLSSGAPIDAHDVDRLIVSNNRINNTAAGKSWHGIVILDWTTGCKAVSVMGNVISNLNNGDGISCESNGVSNIDRGVFSSNVVYNCLGDGIHVQGCTNVNVSGNTLSAAATMSGIGINLTNTPYAVVSDNTVMGPYIQGIYGANGVTSALVTGNSVSGMVYGSATYQGSGIYVNNSAAIAGTQSIQILGNYVSTVDGAGILAKGLGYIRVSGNHINDACKSASATQKAAITASNPGIVESNTIVAGTGTTYGIHPYGANIPSLLNNKFYGSFSGAYVYLAYRNDISQGASTITSARIDYDSVTNIMHTWGTASPTGSLRYIGDVHWNTTPAAAGSMGWVCTTAGIPGTWKTFGAISA